MTYDEKIVLGLVDKGDGRIQWRRVDKGWCEMRCNRMKDYRLILIVRFFVEDSRFGYLSWRVNCALR